MSNGTDGQRMRDLGGNQINIQYRNKFILFTEYITFLITLRSTTDNKKPFRAINHLMVMVSAGNITRIEFIRIMQYFDISLAYYVNCIAGMEWSLRTHLLLQCHWGWTTQEIINTSHAALLNHLLLIIQYYIDILERPTAISRGNGIVSMLTSINRIFSWCGMQLWHLMDLY